MEMGPFFSFLLSNMFFSFFLVEAKQILNLWFNIFTLFAMNAKKFRATIEMLTINVKMTTPNKTIAIVSKLSTELL